MHAHEDRITPSTLAIEKAAEGPFLAGGVGALGGDKISALGLKTLPAVVDEPLLVVVGPHHLAAACIQHHMAALCVKAQVPDDANLPVLRKQKGLVLAGRAARVAAVHAEALAHVLVPVRVYALPRLRLELAVALHLAGKRYKLAGEKLVHEPAHCVSIVVLPKRANTEKSGANRQTKAQGCVQQTR
jgi:hypothetical protein